jgi:hypothetical protein
MSDPEDDPEGRDVTRASLNADLDLALERRDVETFLKLRDEAHGRLSAACQHVAGLLSRAWQLYVPHLSHFLL